jgi:hypothetical protein
VPATFRLATLHGVSTVRAVIVTSTPARASAVAQARPNPLLAAQTIAFLPRMPKSNILLLPLAASR